MIRTWLVVGFVAVLALAAGVSALRGEPRAKPAGLAEPKAPRPDITGPYVPAPGSLRGEIVFAREGSCSSIDLASLEMTRAAGSRICKRLQALSSPASTAPAPSSLFLGDAFLDARDLALGFTPGTTGDVRVAGFAKRPDGLAAVVAIGYRAGEGGMPSELVLELWRRGRLEAAVQLPSAVDPGGVANLGSVVRFSPDGAEVAVSALGERAPLVLYDVRSLALVLGPTGQHGFAWSPDGAWFALAREEGIAVHGAERSSPAYVFPVAADALAWRAS